MCFPIKLNKIPEKTTYDVKGFVHMFMYTAAFVDQGKG